MAAHWVTLTWCVATWTLLDVPDETEDLIRTLDSADGFVSPTHSGRIVRCTTALRAVSNCVSATEAAADKTDRKKILNLQCHAPQISAADSRTGWFPSCHSSSTMAGSAATGWR